MIQPSPCVCLQLCHLHGLQLPHPNQSLRVFLNAPPPQKTVFLLRSGSVIKYQTFLPWFYVPLISVNKPQGWGFCLSDPLLLVQCPVHQTTYTGHSPVVWKPIQMNTFLGDREFFNCSVWEIKISQSHYFLFSVLISKRPLERWRMCETALWSTHVHNRLFYFVGMDESRVTKYSENVIILSFLDLKGWEGGVFSMGDREKRSNPIIGFICRFKIALV